MPWQQLQGWTTCPGREAGSSLCCGLGLKLCKGFCSPVMENLRVGWDRHAGQSGQLGDPYKQRREAEEERNTSLVPELFLLC